MTCAITDSCHNLTFVPAAAIKQVLFKTYDGQSFANPHQQLLLSTEI